MTLLDLDVPPLPLMLCLGGCGKHLSDQRSRKRGYGRECAERLGVIGPSSPRFSRRDGGDCNGQQDMAALLEDSVTTVYVTGAGDAYHSKQHCRDLKAGQQSGAVQGHNLRPIEEMTLDEAVAAGKNACVTCGGTS